jgi:hypothetical protein
VAGLPAISIDGFADHPALVMLYVDRVIARRDVSRLLDRRVRQRIQQALGMYAELAPELAAALDAAESKERD